MGDATSILVTENWQLAVPPCPSLAVKVTVVEPIPDNVLPPAGDWVNVGVEQLSAIVTGEYEGIGTVQEVPNVTDCVPGQVIVGGTLSERVTVNEHEAVLFLTSLVVNTTVELPTPVSVVPATGDWVNVGV